MRVFALAFVLGVLAGCGAGPYGFSRTYEPLDAERAALEGAVEYDPVMVKRMPDEWRTKRVSAFGVVLERKDQGADATLVLSVRTLDTRNACETSQDDSCRTTVSDAEFDKLRAVVHVATAEDRSGELSLGPGSLVRVAGSLGEPDPASGTQTLKATYYRHWPRGYFRTSRAKEVLRR